MKMSLKILLGKRQALKIFSFARGKKSWMRFKIFKK